ncbi:ABC transporter ATP-binding protein [Anaeroselena agilis]|uniref:ATP-binding cassette domain-containing protein n=1 Tax=Anaeroselena agilis TaxID=3063788 RepID=A0ABU3NUK9_9FIRM|nr:ATP-binding cassette domain-containing protein [Selenomonadales bacterium 4137-cl]
MSAPLIEVKSLSKFFVTARTLLGAPRAVLKAVEGVSFAVAAGETLGLVGETGCGKSTVARTLVGLYTPTAGEVLFRGENIHAALAGPDGNLFRRRVQMIFQDPYASLNPRMTVGDIVGEPLDIHGLATGNERRERIMHLLGQVGLSPEHASRFPHEFSGGQRQRVGIARALAAGPEFLVCDEPISALDVSIQAQVVNLLQDLQAEYGLTYLFVAHDLSMIRHICQRVAVMYLGTLVETAPVDELYANPLHPYTQALLSAIPIPDPLVQKNRRRVVLGGEVPSPINPPPGCKFHTRCPRAFERCRCEVPPLMGHGDRFVACHLVNG